MTKTESKVLVDISSLCYTNGGVDILHDINLTVNRGDFIAVIGPNGGGKTTLLKLILGLLQPTRGAIDVRGLRRASGTGAIGYVPQHVNHNLNFPATALDVVLMGNHSASRRLRFGNSRREVMQAHEALEKLGINDCADRKIVALSGGQRQRVLIARALVGQPELLVLDEPTASIDTKGQTDFYDMLKELNKDLTILMVCHDLMIVASYAKSIACLNRRLHYHDSFRSSGDVIDIFYSCSVQEMCPVGVITQNIKDIRPVGGKDD
ncbi:metal ABC transporter ATP-binding protein [Desulforhopalus singaporensis]|uniref:Zinc transport system ATP-binding protein n=1 Tax=Desulforhopalus singaporensis TaxID=91360 RepID=A0A1H0QAI4_9BACT|nr:ABC transporter ATP-binding protein [Desulforhopalus singaporensis]SDP14403.1 zinc transport system ATP-binding protein [Desulforhopalus singaporensis]